MKKILLLIQLLFLILPLYAAGKVEPQKKTGISVFVSILPQVYFVERIGGTRVTVRELVPPGKEPHIYDPSPKQMTSLAGADIYFTIGVPFEKIFLPKIKDSMAKVIIVDTSQGVIFRNLETEDDHSSHVPDSDPNTGEKADDASGEVHQDSHIDDHPDGHELGIQDPHIWLGTREVKIQIRHIRDTLIKFDPDGKSVYETNYNQFILDLDNLHTRISRAMEPVKGEKFFVFHPSFGYFADEYGLRQFPVEIEGKEPGPQQLARIIELVRKEHVKVIFVQPQFSQNQARIIAEYTGCVVVPIDPLKKEWLSNLEEVAAKIEEGLKK